MSQPYRMAEGGSIDRSSSLEFSFDGESYEGFRGDTLASALLANGVNVVGRGVDTGRPRGIFTAGSTEPNALVGVELGRRFQPMARATTLELVGGMRAVSLAGRARLARSESGSESRVDRRYIHTDVLVVGGGPAGLSAALEAGRTGARVILADAGADLGGQLRDLPATVDGQPAIAWVDTRVEELGHLSEVRVLTRTTAIGYYDHNYVVLAERSHGIGLDGRMWHVRAGRVVLATGAHERPLVFADNDRPGIMLADAARTYIHKYGVRPGMRAAVFTNHDAGAVTAAELASAGIEVIAVIDARRGEAVLGTTGDNRLTTVTTGRWDGSGPRRTLPCDLLAVSGGWNPAVQLFVQSGGSVVFDATVQAFVPDQPFQATYIAGATNGTFALVDCIAEGAQAGTRATNGAPPIGNRTTARRNVDRIGANWFVPPDEADDGSAGIAHFVDLERDRTLAEIQQAIRAGLRSVEHIKRYTTIGTGSDQGATSWATASVTAGAFLETAPGALGMPAFRPPATPVSFDFVAGRERGDLYDATRLTSMHAWHLGHGAVFEDVGQWKRPRYYPGANETMEDAVRRECLAARTGVAVVDVSTLGKIDLQGPDAGRFLDRIYTNSFADLPIGSCRYGVMCGIDGMVFDDGVTSRLAEDHFHMTTTTGNAARVLDHLEEWLQTEWPDLRVWCTSVTEQWAVADVVGPSSRSVLADLTDGVDLSAAAFPFMTWRDATVAGIPARIFRISFSGELSYEVNVAAWHGPALWDAIMTAGQAHGITAYGTEALHVMRAEKGFPIIGQETDGSVTPQDLGMDWVVSKRKDFIGRRSQRRVELQRPDRRHLVALLPTDGSELLVEGSQLVETLRPVSPTPMIGHVTSSYQSVALGRTFALAMVQGGRERIGDPIHAIDRHRVSKVTIAKPVLYDPRNQRRDG